MEKQKLTINAEEVEGKAKMQIEASGDLLKIAYFYVKASENVLESLAKSDEHATQCVLEILANHFGFELVEK